MEVKIKQLNVNSTALIFTCLYETSFLQSEEEGKGEG
jgi:hypothetical protein